VTDRATDLAQWRNFGKIWYRKARKSYPSCAPGSRWWAGPVHGAASLAFYGFLAGVHGMDFTDIQTDKQATRGNAVK
jgi:hypothetical protein